MLIDKKDMDILEIYLYRDSILIERLEKDISVTERAIRTRLENLNYIFQRKKLELELKIEKNKVILKDKNRKLKNFIEEFELENYNFNKYERMEIMYFFSLLLSEGFKFEMLENLLNVGKSTLKNDMKEVRKEFQKNKFSFISKPKKGIILIGDENSRRKLLLECILKYFSIRNFDSIEIKNSLDPVSRVMDVWIKKLKISDIKIYFEFLKKLEIKIEKMISDEGFEVLIIYLLIIQSRKTENLLSDKHIKNENFLRATNEYQLLNKMIKSWNYKNNKFSNNEYEILKFIEYLLGTHSYNFDYSFYENWIQIETLVREIIKNVDRSLHVSIVNDNILEDGLINHIRPTIYRIKNNIRLKKLDIREITEKYDLLFNIVKNSVVPLEDYLGKKIETEELAYLTIYFKLAVARSEKKLNQRISNILIVCNFGYGTSQLLAENLKEKYILNIIDVIPYNSFLNYSLENTDLIISTIDINKRNTEIPIVKVSPVLDKNDRDKINGFLREKTYENISLSNIVGIVKKYCKIENQQDLENELKKYLNINREEENKEKTLLELLPFENISIIKKVKTWQEGIIKAGEILLDNEYIKKEYIKECIDIIAQKGMYMLIGKNIILPHGSMKKNIIKTGMSFLKLEKEILFPGNIKIKNVVMLATLDKKEHINAFLQLKKILDVTNFLEKIDNISNETELYSIMKQKFQKIKDENFEILKFK